MTKPVIDQLGSVGLMLDGDPTMIPDQAFTDCMNVRFNGREIEPSMGNVVEPYYTMAGSGVDKASVFEVRLIQPIMFDGFSDGARLLFMLARETGGGTMCVATQNMNVPAIEPQSQLFSDWPADDIWSAYRGQINNCPYFGMVGQKPLGKQYNWTGFDTLPGWGEQTGGDQVVVERRWTCKKMVSFDNRLLALNTIEESVGGVDVPYPTRVRWSGFAQENSFPINWDDTAGNRVPEDYAAAVIDGFAGWQDMSSATQIIDACENGGTLYVYTERETFSMTPSGNDQSPFLTKKLYSDLGVLDIDCCVNAKGFNYVFTGSDVVRHDAVSWKSIASGKCRQWLCDLVGKAYPGVVRMLSYPELNEIWVMCRGDDQVDGDYAKTRALAYNYVDGTWSFRSLPYIYDAVFAPMPLSSDIAPKPWNTDDAPWDEEVVPWGGSESRISQGVMIGSCAAGGIYYLNAGYSESRHVYANGEWAMRVQPIQCYVEKRGMEFGVGERFMICESYLNGRGTTQVKVSMGSADNPDAGYRWETQVITSLAERRRQTWRAEGEAHGYRLEIQGQGSIPVGIKFTVKSTGRAYS